jgi:hypothetical protein
MNIEIIRYTDYEACKDLCLQKDLRDQENALDILDEDLVNNVEIIKFGIKYFLTVILRSSHSRSKLIAPMYNFIETAIKNNIMIAMFIVEMFTYEHILHELLMTVSLITFETSIAGLVNASIEQVYQNEKENVSKYLSKITKETSESRVLRSDVQKALETYLEAKENDEDIFDSWVKEIKETKATQLETIRSDKLKDKLSKGNNLRDQAKDSENEEIEEEEEEEEEEDETEEENKEVISYGQENSELAKEKKVIKRS